MKMWEMKVKRFLDKEETLQSNVNKICGLVIGQFTSSLKSTIKGDKTYEKNSKAFDALWLLEKIKTVTAGVDAKVNTICNLH